MTVMIGRRIFARAAASVLGSAALAATVFVAPAQGGESAVAAWPTCGYRPVASARKTSSSAIDDRYASDQKLRQILGAPTRSEEDAYNGTRVRSYERGELYFRAASGVGPREVHGQILQGYWMNRVLDRVGVPLTDECPTADGTGRYNHFGWVAGDAEGSIYWRPDRGPLIIDDAGVAPGEEGVYDHWEASGWENGVYGWPTQPTYDTSGAPGNQGRYSEFGGRDGFAASIYWHRDSGAHGIRGLIRQRWVDLGRETSYLGYPITDEFDIPTGKQSNFQYGCITWNRTTDVVTDSPNCS
jgi:uncharacterized protein with LGFP repeats